MGTFVILLGGDIEVTPRLMHQVAGCRFIAADSGMRHASSLGIVPELWVGDFDSAGSELLLDYADVPRHSFPAAKDATDGELAVAAARERGAASVILLGGLGGQGDHVTAHLGLLLRLAAEGLQAFITSGEEEAHALIPGAITLDCGEDERLSVVPWSDLTALSLRGVAWPLAARNVRLGSTLTLSNVATGPVNVELQAGQGIIFRYPLGLM